MDERISSKVNVLARLEFEPTYYVSLNVMETLPLIKYSYLILINFCCSVFVY